MVQLPLKPIVQSEPAPMRVEAGPEPRAGLGSTTTLAGHGDSGGGADGVGDLGRGGGDRRGPGLAWWAGAAAILLAIGLGGSYAARPARPDPPAAAAPAQSLTSVRILSDPDEMREAIGKMQVTDPFAKERLLSDARLRKIHLLEFNIQRTSATPEWYRITTRTLDTAASHYDYEVKPYPITFFVPIKPGEKGFGFTALSTRTDGPMKGLWRTAAGDTPYSLRPGDGLPVPLR